MVAQDDLRFPFHIHPHVDHPTDVEFSAEVEVEPGTADDVYCSSSHSVGIALSSVRRSSFVGFGNHRVCDPSGEADRKNYFDCLGWSTWTFLQSLSLKYWCSSFRRTVDARVATEEILVAGVDSSVFPYSCGQIGNAGDGDDLDSGNILHHLDSGCNHNEVCCSIHFEHAQVVDVRLVNMMHFDCHNSCFGGIGHRSYCGVKLWKLAWSKSWTFMYVRCRWYDDLREVVPSAAALKERIVSSGRSMRGRVGLDLSGSAVVR